MIKYGVIERCQVCEERDLVSVLFLGFLPPVNTMRAIGARPDAEPWFPAEMLYCASCHLTQLGYAADPAILFPPDYPYTSGTTRILRENFAELAREVRERIGLQPGDLFVDIGSNDGTLLSNFQAAGCRVVGIEPTDAGDITVSRGITTLKAFFSRESASAVRREHGPPKVVTATNVFAHIHGIGGLMEALEVLTGDDGIFISESHYLRDLVATLQYDTIYHEHLRYYSLTSLKALLGRYGYGVFYAKRIPTHGGSIRVYAAKSKRYKEDPAVGSLLREEAAEGLASPRWIPGFRERVLRSKFELYELLARYKGEGKRIYGISAPSRASTLIHFAALDEAILDCVLEIQGSKKLGKYIPGTLIPVLDESKLYEDQPQAVLILSWHIADELCPNLKRRGYRGDFILPLPSPRVVRNAEVDEEKSVEVKPRG